MGQFKQEDVKGLVRNADSTHTAVLNNGERKVLDRCETSSLMNRLDKDRSKMEREGTREKERAPESRDSGERAKASAERDRKLRNELARDPRRR